MSENSNPPVEQKNLPVPPQGPKEKPEEQGAPPKPEPKPKPKTAQQKLDEAADHFASLVKKLGGPANVKAFYELHQTGAFDAGGDNEEELASDGKLKAKDDGKGDPKKKVEEADKRKRDFERAKELADQQKLNLELQDRSKFEVGLPNRPPGYGSKYLDHEWQIKAIGGVDNPTTLKDEAWATILRSNKVLYGWVIRERGNLAKARRPAFELKPPPKSSDSSATNLPIPDFEVDDASSISIKETKTEIERSLAQNGFSSEAIQGSLAAGGWGASLNVSAGRSIQRQSGSSYGDFSSVQEYTATYNFPRVRLYMDEFDLQLTPECRTIVGEILTSANAISQNLATQRPADFEDAVKIARRHRDRFFAQYGHVFATTLQLGGQLTATRSAASIGSVSDAQRRDAMKTAAAASFEYGKAGVGAKASASKEEETNDSSQSHRADTSNTSQLAWSARGGNTLLCANPPEWANSLAGFQTWRTVEQSAVLTLPDLISRLEDSQIHQISKIRDTFQLISQQQFQEIPENLERKWTHKVRLETPDGRQLIMKDGRLNLGDRGVRHADSVTFTILEADVTKNSEADPVTDQVYNGQPYFLPTANTYARDPSSEGAQIPGLWVDSEGFVREKVQSQPCICRWSFRAKTDNIDFQTRFSDNFRPLRDGDEVKLYCHSYSSGGGYLSRHDHLMTPFWAPCVRTSSDGTSELKVSRLTGSDFHSYATRIAGPEPGIEYNQSAEIKWPETDEYDLIARDDDNAKTAQCLRDLDCGRATDSQKKQLLRLRNLFGFRHERFEDFFADESIIVKWSSSVPSLAQTLQGANTLSGNMVSPTGLKVIDIISRVLATRVNVATRRGNQASRCSEEAIFRLRYVWSSEEDA